MAHNPDSRFSWVKGFFPTGYIGTTIVDSKHIFQFTRSPLDQEGQNGTVSFENTFYSNVSEFVENTTRILEDVWKNAVAPSTITVEQLAKLSTPMIAPVPDDEYSGSRKDSPYQKLVFAFEEKPGLITEEYVLNKIINAKRIPVSNPSKDPLRFYGCRASAVIHPPSSFNLPDILLTFFHWNKQSLGGAEDCFIVYLWLETPKGNAFLPVAIAGDNSKTVELRKSLYACTPASQNCHVLGKDEIQLQVHGNTFFAGWTVPIPLLPPKYILPPAAASG